ncbi:hypothetical protein EW146_g8093 [Bondarzewia mesenterica]|uniref:Uncharacterized protein n=1 Tax=Bondarzewia mesenterica TaxID=1095465 RepID=A0A4S4LHQ4_9AGAM|nr:hypothetical protein EW146_g8093 [Bondarzewia mesenterica]
MSDCSRTAWWGAVRYMQVAENSRYWKRRGLASNGAWTAGILTNRRSDVRHVCGYGTRMGVQAPPIPANDILALRASGLHEQSQSSILKPNLNINNWDSFGRAVGYSGDPCLHAPQARGPNRIPTFRAEGGRGYSADWRRHERPEQEIDGMGVTYPISPRSDRCTPTDAAAPLSPSPPGLPQAQTQVQVVPATFQNTTAYIPMTTCSQTSSSNPYVPYVPEQTSTLPTPTFAVAVPVSPQTSGAAVTALYYQPHLSTAAQHLSAVAAPYVSSSSPVTQYAPPLTQYTPIITQRLFA